MFQHHHKRQGHYGDVVARKRKRAVIVKVIFVFVGLIFASGVCGYFLFFTSYFQINDISFQGLRTIRDEEVLSFLNDLIDQKSLRIFDYTEIKYGANIIFFKPEIIREKLLNQFPALKAVNINKNYFHRINLTFSERNPIGIWCFGDDCHYFDDDGQLWGNSVKSSGPLLLSVNDLRNSVDGKVDVETMKKIMKVASEADNIGVKVISANIPVDYPIDSLKIYTDRNYYLIMDADSNIEQSMDTLRIFLEDRGGDFSAEYIDLRMEGRIYYK